MRAFHLVQQAHAALFRAADRAMRDAEGVTAAQSTVLFVLTASDGLPISAISERMRMGKSTLTSVIDRMVASGLVRREKNPNDGRVSNIFIEEAGKAVVERTAASVREINSGLLSPFSLEEQATIERFLVHLRQNAEDIVQPAAPSASARHRENQ